MPATISASERRGGKSPKAGLKRGHQQGRRNALTGNICHREKKPGFSAG